MVKDLLGGPFGLALKEGFEPFYIFDHISHRTNHFASGLSFSCSGETYSPREF